MRKIKLKEPYWFINKKHVRMYKEEGFNVLNLIYDWFRAQVRSYNQLHFKRCGISTNSHFFNNKFHCLRCNKGMRELNNLRRIREIKRK